MYYAKKPIWNRFEIDLMIYACFNLDKKNTIKFIVSYILLNHKTTRCQSESENRYTQYALADPGGAPGEHLNFFRSLRLWFMFK